MSNLTTTDTNNRRMLVMKASAGSGKTYNLALQYIKHLLFINDDSGKLVPRRKWNDERIINGHRLLLAITFTNKATDEMKRRIVSELYNLAQPEKKSDYLQEFMEESGLTEEKVRKLAQEALNELLFDYSHFNVSTIDSFFQSVLRNFARELDRDFNYDIQIEEDYAISVAVHNFLLSLGREGSPKQVDNWVRDYQKHRMTVVQNSKKWKFFDDSGDLTTFAGQIKSELFRSRMKAVRDYLGSVDDNGDFHSDFTKIKDFMKFLNEAITVCEDKMMPLKMELFKTLEPLEDSLNSKRSFKSWLTKTKELLEKDANAEWLPLPNALIGANRDYIISQFLSKQIPDDATIDHLFQLVPDIIRYDLNHEFLLHISKNLGLLGMLAMIDVFLERFRHETNSILIGDTNELIGTVLDSGSEFVYERIGTTISHFLIDEFQDTSAKQYKNFLGLLKESLSVGNFNMLIGDAKQSIYRFRNADPTVFREKVDKDFAEQIYMPPVEPGKPTSTNYRSSQYIVEFNNELFERVKDVYRSSAAVVGTYADVKQGLSPNVKTKKVPGYVKLLLGGYNHLMDDVVIADAVKLVHGTVEAPDGEDEAGDKEVAAANLEVEDILPGYLLKLHERYQWGQIGVLVNTNKEGIKVVEAVLEYNKKAPAGRTINIISGESLLLNNSPIIRRIIAMLRFIDVSWFSASEDDDDEDKLSNVAQSIARKRESDQRLYAGLNMFIKDLSVNGENDALTNGEMLVKSLNSLEQPRPAAGVGEETYRGILESILPPAGELTTLTSIVETIIASFKNNEGDSAHVDGETAFLMAFQDVVTRFASQRNGGSVREFLKYWDEKKYKLAVSSAEGGDAVNVMTIHKAKGLEFDCVVIPWADWDLTNNSQEHDYWMPSEDFVDVLEGLQLPGLKWTEEMLPPLVNISKKAALALDKGGLLQGKAHTFVRKQQDDQLIDCLNKTYVAFTRPRTELHILSEDPDKKKKTSKSKKSAPKAAAPLEPAKNLKELMSRLAPEIMDVIPMGDGLNVKWYKYGELSTQGEIKSKIKDEESDIHRVDISKYPVTALPTSLSVRVDHASSTHVKAGIRLHALLSSIGDRNDVDRIIAQGLKHGVITTGDTSDLCGIDSVNAHIRGPIMDPASRVYAWFDPANKVYSERTITSASDSLFAEDGIENLRPDRIVRLPDGQMLVIDYKSGMRKDKKYQRQIQGYINKLRLIFPGASIAGRIWYLTHDVILDETGKVL